MDVKARIRMLMEARGWSEYRLALESGLSQSTIANLFGRNTNPSIATLESICAAFGLTLSQFFADTEQVSLTAEQQELFHSWAALTAEQKDAVNHVIRVMKAP